MIKNLRKKFFRSLLRTGSLNRVFLKSLTVSGLCSKRGFGFRKTTKPVPFCSSHGRAN